MINRLNKRGLRNDYLLVIVLWLLFEVLWFIYFGIHFGLEAEKYIHEARQFLQNQTFSQQRFLFYSSTIAIIAFSFWAKIGLYGALLIILFINLISYLYFFRALKKQFTNRTSALLIVAFLLSFWPYQTWSLYLYTECMFYSATLLLFAHLILFDKLSMKYLVVTFFILGLVIISRPLGILFVLPTLLFIFLKLSQKQRLIAFAVLVAFIFLFNYVVQAVFTTTSDWNMTRAISEGDIICDIPGTTTNTKLVLTQHSNQLYQLFFYLSHNFSHFWELALLRLKYFFTLVRDYYSPNHNAYLVIILMLLYVSIIIGIRKILTFYSAAFSSFIFASILLFAVTIALQCDDYHNRFFLTLMPLLVIMAAVVVLPIIYRVGSFLVQHKY